ncbi:MAG: DUF2835 domain-containing protein [Bacteroidetes bacterium]|jgi:hypothetical protein|nr:DUF2835 domain-containing protein [Bacteroidota bacterium]MCL5035456.1 DUF2835 domain-containing protein [Bacteroidota bacterium]
MKRFEFHLDISSEEFLNYYRGTAKQAVVQLANGLKIQFPASLLQQYVTSGGIKGRFVLTCDDDFKNAELQRLPSR